MATKDFNAVVQETRAEIAPRYSLCEYLGAGTYGVVFSAIDRNGTVTDPPKPNVALKRLQCHMHTLESMLRLLREILVMKHLRHPNIVGLSDLFVVGTNVYVVSELMESDLAKIRETRQPLSERHVRYFLFQLLSALDHMHRAGVMHRDVKPANVFVNHNCKLKLGDLGLSREVTQLSAAHDDLTEYVCTRWYRASGGASAEPLLHCSHRRLGGRVRMC